MISRSRAALPTLIAMTRNPRLATLAIVWSLFAWPAAAGADTANGPQVPVATPVVSALATLAPRIAGQPPPVAPTRPASAPRARVNEVDEPLWVMTVVEVCATERRTTVDLYSSLPADVTVRVYDADRTVARTRLAGAMGELTARLAEADLRRGRLYRVEIAAQRSDEPTFKDRRRLFVRSTCE